uniref:Carboxylic ester hydrolase n=1 Tax=Omphisa fuscidentalis TaxID=386629 RepID=B1Q145_9NEOP|nr:juvenile hormone esterase [Omphisa fuscidentalis]
MTASIVSTALAAFLLYGAVANAAQSRTGCDVSARTRASRVCDVLARTRAGRVCGVRRCASSSVEYASFRGVPYAKQPLGELRFKELQPLDHWTDVLNATTEGPVCQQTDVLYKGIQTHQGGMSEACIHANIHVPLEALPKSSDSVQTNNSTNGVPIFVFVHGGGFSFGSGDADLHGPEYLVSKGTIVITFNYRLNVFGFLSLNSDRVPGNNGLRDCVTLLRWVRDNAPAFGGNPDDVTLAGQSAGAAVAHLLTLSPATEGLFKRVVLFSGVGNSEFFSTSPVFAKIAADLFLAKVGIKPTLDPEEIHGQLVKMPIDNLMSAHSDLLNLFGFTVFSPVVESTHTGVTTIIDEDPDALIAKGRGRDIPHIIGFTSSECETFRPRFADMDIVETIAATPAILVTPKLTYQTPPATVPLLLKLIEGRYFNESRTLDDFIGYCSDAYYKYPAVKLAEKRAAIGGAPTYLFRFAYGGRRSAIKGALHLDFKGAGHIADITYIFRVNSVLGPLRGNTLDERNEDDEIKNLMTDYMINFMRTSNPTPEGEARSWPTATLPRLHTQHIVSPHEVENCALNPELREMVAFFDGLHHASHGD